MFLWGTAALLCYCKGSRCYGPRKDSFTLSSSSSSPQETRGDPKDDPDG